MSSDWWLTNDIIFNDTLDQFRMFSSLKKFFDPTNNSTVLENYLQWPLEFQTNSILPIDPSLFRSLVAK
jgi:hypothetical protein